MHAKKYTFPHSSSVTSLGIMYNLTLGKGNRKNQKLSGGYTTSGDLLRSQIILVIPLPLTPLVDLCFKSWKAAIGVEENISYLVTL